MLWQNYQLDNTILRTTEALTLWRMEEGIVEVGKDTLALPIKLDDQRKGYVFHGHGKLLLDTIVETDKGAIGTPVEKEINEPFLMLGNSEEIQQRLDSATQEDLTKMGYKSDQEFKSKAENLFDQFLGKGRIRSLQCCGNDHGFVFAFPNEARRLDILIAKGSKLVYKALDKVFVSNKHKVVLKTPTEVILSHNRRSFIVKR